MPKIKDRCGGRGQPCAAVFPDCEAEERSGSNVHPLSNEPADPESFARSIEKYGKLCRYSDTTRYKYGWFTKPAPIPFGWRNAEGSKPEVETSKPETQTSKPEARSSEDSEGPSSALIIGGVVNGVLIALAGAAYGVYRRMKQNLSGGAQKATSPALEPAAPALASLPEPEPTSPASESAPEPEPEFDFDPDPKPAPDPKPQPEPLFLEPVPLGPIAIGEGPYKPGDPMPEGVMKAIVSIEQGFSILPQTIQTHVLKDVWSAATYSDENMRLFFRDGRFTVNALNHWRAIVSSFGSSFERQLIGYEEVTFGNKILPDNFTGNAENYIPRIIEELRAIDTLFAKLPLDSQTRIAWNVAQIPRSFQDGKLTVYAVQIGHGLARGFSRTPAPAVSEPAPQPEPPPFKAPPPKGRAARGEDSVTGEYKPRERSESVTAQWNGNEPEPLVGPEALAGFDVDIPENRTTIPAPPLENSVLARLPSREVEWVPMSQRAGSEARSIEALAGAISNIGIYAGLPREDIERRAEFYYELWVSQPAEKSEALLRNLSTREMIAAGDAIIPQSWVIKQEAALNARLRLLENRFYRDLPDTFTEKMTLTKEKDIRKFDKYAQRFPERVLSAVDGEGGEGKELIVEILRDGPARLIQRSAMAMVSKFHLFEELADEVFSRDGLARILLVHSDRSPVDKLAYRISRLIDFSELSAGQLDLLAKRYVEMWEDLPKVERAKIWYSGLKEENKVEYVEISKQEEHIAKAKAWGIEPLLKPIVKGGAQTAANVSEPPDSWLRWQRFETKAWLEAERLASEGDTNMEFQARVIHRQLFVPENEKFMGLLAGDRYRLCKFVALGMAEARKDPEFMKNHVNENGYISLEGIDIIMKKGGVNDSRMDLRVSRARGLRLTRERLRDRGAPNVWNSKAGWDHVK